MFHRYHLGARCWYPWMFEFAVRYWRRPYDLFLLRWPFHLSACVAGRRGDRAACAAGRHRIYGLIRQARQLLSVGQPARRWVARRVLPIFYRWSQRTESRAWVSKSLRQTVRPLRQRMLRTALSWLVALPEVLKILAHATFCVVVPVSVLRVVDARARDHVRQQNRHRACRVMYCA